MRSSVARSRARSPSRCFQCGREGHFKAECSELNKERKVQAMFKQQRVRYLGQDPTHQPLSGLFDNMPEPSPPLEISEVIVPGSTVAPPVNNILKPLITQKLGAHLRKISL